MRRGVALLLLIASSDGFDAAHLLPFARTSPPAFNDSAMVYTYIDLSHASRALSQASDAMDMLSLWAASWARHGWTPRILTKSDVMRDPGYADFVRVANATATRVSRSRGHATTSDATFRLRGLTQFYAKAVAGAGVLTDSDVINYGLTPEDVRSASRGVPADVVVVHDGRNCELRRSGHKSSQSGHAFRTEGLTTAIATAATTGTSAASSGLLSRWSRGGGASAPAARWAKDAPVIACVKTNNGVTSGAGAAYHKLIGAMLTFQQRASSSYFLTPPTRRQTPCTCLHRHALAIA